MNNGTVSINPKNNNKRKKYTTQNDNNKKNHHLNNIPCYFSPGSNNLKQYTQCSTQCKTPKKTILYGNISDNITQKPIPRSTHMEKIQIQPKKPKYTSNPTQQSKKINTAPNSKRRNKPPPNIYFTQTRIS